MTTTVEYILTIAGAFCVFLNIYGVFTYNRRLLLSGLFFYCIIPFIQESMAYKNDKLPVHILLFISFIIQLAFTLPNNNNYSTQNLPAIKLAIKIALCLTVINILGAVNVFILNPTIPFQFGIFHITFILSIAYASYIVTKKRE